MAIITNQKELDRERLRLKRRANRLEEEMSADVHRLSQRLQPLRIALEGSKPQMLSVAWSVGKLVIPFIIGNWSQKLMSRRVAQEHPWVAMLGSYLLNAETITAIIERISAFVSSRKAGKANQA